MYQRRKLPVREASATLSDPNWDIIVENLGEIGSNVHRSQENSTSKDESKQKLDSGSFNS